jgi:hypothetical protein
MLIPPVVERRLARAGLSARPAWKTHSLVAEYARLPVHHGSSEFRNSWPGTLWFASSLHPNHSLRNRKTDLAARSRHSGDLTALRVYSFFF